MSQTTVALALFALALFALALFSGAIVQVLKKSSQPMRPREIYDAILAQALYEFKAKDAFGVVRNQLSRHCEGKGKDVLNLKLFRRKDLGSFELILNKAQADS